MKKIITLLVLVLLGYLVCDKYIQYRDAPERAIPRARLDAAFKIMRDDELIMRSRPLALIDVSSGDGRIMAVGPVSYQDLEMFKRLIEDINQEEKYSGKVLLFWRSFSSGDTYDILKVSVMDVEKQEVVQTVEILDMNQIYENTLNSLKELGV